VLGTLLEGHGSGDFRVSSEDGDCFDHYDGLLVLNTDGKYRFQVVSLALQCRKDEIGET